MHFKAPGYRNVYNPIIPYEGTIDGGLRKGMSLYFQGTIPQDITSFHINLEGGGDVIFHFNPRFSPEEMIVFNTNQNGWQTEERVHEMPFHKGKSFQLVFIVTSEGYKLNVNGSQIHMYKHRIPLEKVRSLRIQGDIMMETVSIIGGVQGGIQAYPGQGEMVSIPYMGPIDGGLRTGMSVYFYGVVPHGAKR
ncbi:hypothetical protein SKAU_G00087170 [Synaphobranchus kaupii]|uniref:Galectin n=1 Tax=Synaphobranchus kaupii TaxID=118154 RepID=A0A9Q1J5S4_SYNKA|nr:hypothetical protein SKAU_G00087170 [Synaphobranchus kaupii]